MRLAAGMIDASRFIHWRIRIYARLRGRTIDRTA